jgi:hypothetical protein
MLTGEWHNDRFTKLHIFSGSAEASTMTIRRVFLGISLRQSPPHPPAARSHPAGCFAV